MNTFCLRLYFFLPHKEKRTQNEDGRQNVLMIMYVSKTEEIRGWIKLLYKELHNNTLRQVLYLYPNPIKENGNSVNMARMEERYTLELG